MGQMSKALVTAFVHALVAPNHNGARTHVRGVAHTSNTRRHQPPYHWHVVWGKTKYVMEYIGHNNRTGKNVYQCPFCGGKAERPY
jgi:hypothetical protein